MPHKKTTKLSKTTKKNVYTYIKHMTTINLRKKKKNKEKYSYLIAFNHKQCGSDYGKQ